uniref:Mating-type protein MAT1-1-2 n=1 Tax=Thielaviopsis paradoxa TaxID=13001 RepID=A0A2K8HRL5_9PEZI|nr:mating-type protein MAT1-1-2 [Thielaviopsis paradoxa]
MSSEYDKVAPLHLERELPLTVRPKSIEDLFHEIFSNCLKCREKNPENYEDFPSDIMGSNSIEEVIAINDNLIENSLQPAICALRAISAQLKLDYKDVIHDALRAWKRAAVPFILDVDLTRGVALQGYRAIILCTRLWKREVSQNLHRMQAHLAASSSTTTIIAALMIIHWVYKNKADASKLITKDDMQSRTIGTEVFIRFACDQLLPNIAELRCFPGRDLGLRPGFSIQFTQSLVVQLAMKGVGGETAWGAVPYLHPVHKVIGSQWAKFFRNRSQALFFKGDYTEPRFIERPIMFAIPSQTIDWIERIRERYNDQELKMEHEDEIMPGNSGDTFACLAEATGEPYPDFISPDTTHKTFIKAVPLYLSQPSGIGQVLLITFAFLSQSRYPATDLNGSISYNLIETFMACVPDAPDTVQAPPMHIGPPGLDRPPEGLLIFKTKKLNDI